MKRLLFVLLLTGIGNLGFAANGYQLRVKITDRNLKDSTLYLARYYAKNLPTIYVMDSTVVNKNGIAVFQNKDSVIGGIYMIMLSDQATYFEFLLENGENVDITTAINDLPYNVNFKGSPHNERYQQYVTYLRDFSARQKQFIARYSSATNAADSARILNEGDLLAKDLRAYRQNYIQKYPKDLLSSIFLALFVPEVPKEMKGDSVAAYYYYKNHYWDDFNFQDDRLIHTPLYESKLETYLTQVAVVNPDSIIKEANILLAKTRGTKELFKYTLHWVTQYGSESKLMGMDEIFVYMVENYHMKGDAYWMPQDMLAKYIDKAKKIAPNVLGNVGPDISVIDMNNAPHKLSEINAKYTLLVFWAPDCGGCQKEMPKIDSLYQAQLKKKGVKIFAVRTEGDETLWKNFIEKQKLSEWLHVHDPNHKSNYKADYDVYGTPSIYLLDEKKIIIGKRLDHKTIMQVIEMHEDLQRLKK